MAVDVTQTAAQAAPVIATAPTGKQRPNQGGGTSRAGVGFSELPHSREAGEAAAREALARAGVDACDLTIVFTTGKHDPVGIRDGVRSVVGPRTRIIGGYGGGVITNDTLGYEGLQVGVAVLASPSMQIDTFVETGLPDNEYNVGLALGRQIKNATYAGEPNLVLLYDIVKQGLTDAGVSLNMATPLLAGMTEALDTWPRTAGGGLMGGVSWMPTFQWLDDRVLQHSAMALVLSGDVRMDTITIHGCKPASGYHTVTRAERNVVLELDGRPAAQLVGELMGGETEWRVWPLFLTLGVNNGDPFGEYNEDDYAIRLCMAIDEQRGGLVMFGDDLQAGTQVQIMRRTVDFDHMAPRVQALLDRLADRRPFFALYIDCAGRERVMSGADREEAEEIQQVLGEKIPLLGFYSGCEIARAGGVMQHHNWTGVLSIFSEAR